jgi:hypothetical protein
MNLEPCDYMVRYGIEPFLGRFQPDQPLGCQRGDRVVVHSHRGVELGTVLCEATAGHAQFLSERRRGLLLRLATPADEDRAGSERLFDEACRVVEELRLPVEIVDIEVLFEPATVIVHALRTGLGTLKPLIRELSRRLDALVEIQDLALGIATEYGDQHQERQCGSAGGHAGGGCGSGNCGGGNCGGGGCGGGGCGSGQCGSTALRKTQPEAAEHFIQLRNRMTQQVVH